jgi:hypothetical protein
MGASDARQVEQHRRASLREVFVAQFKGRSPGSCFRARRDTEHRGIAISSTQVMVEIRGEMT